MNLPPLFPKAPQGELILGTSVKLMYMYFFKNRLFAPECRLDKLCIYSNDKKGRIFQNFIKFHEPRGKGSCIRTWPF